MFFASPFAEDIYFLLFLGIIWQMRPRYGVEAFIFAAAALGVLLNNLFDAGMWFTAPYQLTLFSLLGLVWGYRLATESAPRLSD